MVAGLPGETVIVERTATKRPRLIIGDRVESLEIPPGGELRSGVIPAGAYLLLNGDRNLVSGAQHPDSRKFGFIAGDRLEKKVVTPLYFFN